MPTGHTWFHVWVLPHELDPDTTLMVKSTPYTPSWHTEFPSADTAIPTIPSY